MTADFQVRALKTRCCSTRSASDFLLSSRRPAVNWQSGSISSSRLLARLRGTVTLSYSCHNLVDDRELFPSSIVLSAFRILSGKREGDHAALNRWLAPAESFAPDVAEKALTESEWWLWRTTGPEDVIEPAAVIGARYPHLGRGYFLAGERSSDRFTVFDGWIPDPGPELDLTAAVGTAGVGQQARNARRLPAQIFLPLCPRNQAARRTRRSTPTCGSTRSRADRSCMRCSSDSSRTW